MHPELFSIGDFTIHTYGFMIMIGATLGFIYMSYSVKKDLGIEREKIQNLAILIILAAFVGGKLFFYFENPSYYFDSWDNMRRNFRTDFVFYGSLLFAIPVVIWYFRKEKWLVWSMLDPITIVACIIDGTKFFSTSYGE